MAVSQTEADARLTRVQDHIEELRRSGRDRDAEAVQFVHALAEHALARQRATPERELLTTGQAALALGLSDQTIRNWVAAGRLPSVRRGARTMIPRQVVEEEIERSRLPASEVVALEDSEAKVAFRKQLLAGIPRDISIRLGELHDRMEDGQELSSRETSEMISLERTMAQAAAGTLKGTIRQQSSSTT